MATDKEEPIYHIDLNADGEENIPAAPEVVEPEPAAEEPVPAPVVEEAAPVIEEPAPAVEEPAPAPVAPRVETVETVEKVEPAAPVAPVAPPAPAPVPSQQKPRSNVPLWITIAVLAAIIIGGVTWYVVTYVLNDKDKTELVDDDGYHDEETAQVISYETDDTPTDPAEQKPTEPLDNELADEHPAPTEDRTSSTTTAEDNATDNSSSSSAAPDPMTGYVFSGSITGTDGTSSSIVIESNISNHGVVNGISEHASRNYNIYGHYIKEINRLVINEQNGGKFEGTLNGNQYTGKYRDAEGTTHNFSFRVRIHRAQ